MSALGVLVVVHYLTRACMSCLSHPVPQQQQQQQQQQRRQPPPAAFGTSIAVAATPFRGTAAAIRPSFATPSASPTKERSIYLPILGIATECSPHSAKHPSRIQIRLRRQAAQTGSADRQAVESRHVHLRLKCFSAIAATASCALCL